MRGIETQNTPGGLLPPIKREDYMQYMMQNRVTHTQAADFQTPYIDVSDSPLLTLNAIVYSNGGTSPVASVTLQTSDDLETWVNVGSALAISAVGSELRAFAAHTLPYGRYVRLSIDITGTDPIVTYSVALNTFQSS